MRSVRPIKKRGPINVLTIAQKLREITNPDQLSPSFFGPVGGEKQREFILHQGWHRAAGNGNFPQLGPDVSRVEWECNALA
jgi:hypothetical protein